MNFLRGVRGPAMFAALLLVAASAVGQDADKQKMMDIEKAFAANPTPGPESAATAKQYLLDATLMQLTGLGQVGQLTKARIVELSTKPNPADPDVKSKATISDFKIQIYGDTALVAYKFTNTDTGHKDATLNSTDHFTCLDTFVKRNGSWLVVGNACAPSSPLPKVEWDAAKKAMGEMPKDVKDAYQ
jgi:hypothetical protein